MCFPRRGCLDSRASSSNFFFFHFDWFSTNFSSADTRTGKKSSFGLIGLDSLTHLVEEIPEPHLNIPKAMIWAVCIGAGSSWIVLMVLLFVMNDYDAVVSSSAGALLEIMYQATGNTAGAICLQVFPIVAMEVSLHLSFPAIHQCPSITQHQGDITEFHRC